MKHIFTVTFLVIVFSACSPMVLSRLNSNTMSQLHLGMTKQALTEILGKNYTISEKRMEGEKEVEVLSYRNYPYTDEFYQFIFVDGDLNEWYRDLIPSYEVTED